MMSVFFYEASSLTDGLMQARLDEALVLAGWSP